MTNSTAERSWQFICEAGSYDEPTLPRLLYAILAHRFWHWRRGDGWVD